MRRFWCNWQWCALLAFYSIQMAYAQGRAFICYEVMSTSTPGTDLQLQRLTLDGSLGWATGPEEKPVATTPFLEREAIACADGDGGAIVVYVREYVDGERKGDTDIVAQRFDSAGRPVWNGGTEPVIIAGSTDHEDQPVLLTDGSGGVFIVFRWTGANTGGDSDLLGQRLSAQGNLLWNLGQPVPIAASDYPEANPVLISDGEGGLLVICEWCGPEQDSDIMAQRISRRGLLLWNDGQRAVDIAATTQAERKPSAVSDGQGGAFICYEQEYLSGERKGQVDVAIQRLSGYGRVLWGPTALASSEAWEGDPVLISDGAGGAIAAFITRAANESDLANKRLMTQRISLTGTMLWGNGQPLTLASTPVSNHNVHGLPSSDGGAIWVYETQAVAGQTDIVAQLMSNDGQFLWNGGQGPVAVANTPNAEELVQIVSDGAGGTLVLVSATVAEGDTEVRAARLAADGTLPWRDITVAGGPGRQQHPHMVVVSSR